MQMDSPKSPLQPPTYGNLVTILSIDGGGIRGLIPAVILGFLESELQVKNNPLKNATLADIAISTSAAPTYLPAHFFRTEDSTGNVKEYNLIDGGVAANNPALVAIGEVTNEITRGSSDFFPIRPNDYGRFLVLSLGTGSHKCEEKFNAKEVAGWGLLSWLTHDNSTPLIDAFTQASSDMVDFHLSAVFRALHSEPNYIRIQDDTLNGDAASVDIATVENLDILAKTGEELLKKPVSRVNLDSGSNENAYQTTNGMALIKLAGILSKEKKIRDVRSPHGKAPIKM